MKSFRVDTLGKVRTYVPIMSLRHLKLLVTHKTNFILQDGDAFTART